MPEQLEKRIVDGLKDVFDEYAASGSLTFDQLGELFKACGETIPNHQLRDYASKYSFSANEQINFSQFLEMMSSMNGKAVYESKLMQQLKESAGVSRAGGTEKSAEGTKHSVKDNEVPAFATYINRLLHNDPDLKSQLPIDKSNDDLFKKLSNGVILCKLINLADSSMIDVRSINTKKLNKFTTTENLNLALNSSRALGCYVVNISAEDIIAGTVHLVLGLLWQLLRAVLFAKLNLTDTPNLAVLLEEGEVIEDLLRLSPEELLLRWANYQMMKFGSSRRISNFSSDLKDSEVYSVLIDRCLSDQKVSDHLTIMGISDHHKRAEEVIRNFDAANLPYLLTATDIVKGNQKLNIAFLANLFNLYPCLEEVEKPIEIVETREEKMYRNWMNSNGVNPKINFLYTDLNDGLALLYMISIMFENAVDWKKVNKHPMKPVKADLLKVENCQYVVGLCKTHGITLVGVSASNLKEGDKLFVLGCLHSMLRSYTLNLLQELTKDKRPIADAEIISWANEKCDVPIKSFRDPAIKDSLPILKLIDAIQPGSVNFSYMDSDLSKNAGYAISCGRKIGARIYALPEDIVECNGKMILTIYACLMARDLKGSA